MTHILETCPTCDCELHSEHAAPPVKLRPAPRCGGGCGRPLCDNCIEEAVTCDGCEMVYICRDCRDLIGFEEEHPLCLSCAGSATPKPPRRRKIARPGLFLVPPAYRPAQPEIEISGPLRAVAA